ncbi:MAG: hypothetical protein J3K34DRAFT_497678 [Monoraphidium minutum]|nr:MAG: hypothetical protein J3K34DRAFT_497678 [Monoraphidium minutum]
MGRGCWPACGSDTRRRGLLSNANEAPPGAGPVSDAARGDGAAVPAALAHALAPPALRTLLPAVAAALPAAAAGGVPDWGRVASSERRRQDAGPKMAADAAAGGLPPDSLDEKERQPMVVGAPAARTARARGWARISRHACAHAWRIISARREAPARPTPSPPAPCSAPVLLRQVTNSSLALPSRTWRRL